MPIKFRFVNKTTPMPEAPETPEASKSPQDSPPTPETPEAPSLEPPAYAPPTPHPDALHTPADVLEIESEFQEWEPRIGDVICSRTGRVIAHMSYDSFEFILPETYENLSLYSLGTSKPSPCWVNMTPDAVIHRFHTDLIGSLVYLLTEGITRERQDAPRYKMTNPRSVLQGAEYTHIIVIRRFVFCALTDLWNKTPAPDQDKLRRKWLLTCHELCRAMRFRLRYFDEYNLGSYEAVRESLQSPDELLRRLRIKNEEMQKAVTRMQDSNFDSGAGSFATELSTRSRPVRKGGPSTEKAKKNQQVTNFLENQLKDLL